MRYWALDVLACMYCRHYPLKLVILDSVTEDISIEDITKPFCRSYCGYLKEPIVKDKEYPCEECLKIDIVEGILYCSKCLHWYPIRKGIVVIMPDNKRKKEKDLEFLEKYRDKIPREILENGKPFNLTSK